MSEFLHFDAFLRTLPIMARGMFGVFFVIAVLILSIYVMNRVFRKR